MLFNSFHFVYFFLAITAFYYLLSYKYRWVLLLIGSYYFYMNWKPVYALLILFSTFTTYLAALGIQSSERATRRKLYLYLSVLINFSILFVFKYFNFINQSVYEGLTALHIRWPVPDLNLLLPVGISFYTFQAVGYSVDVYRGEIKAEKHFGIYALFVSFFPQLVAGPIERAKNLLPQFRSKVIFDVGNISSGMQKALWGFFIKLVIADRAAIYVDAIYNHVEFHTSLSFVLATFIFAIQIYCDFAGYSLIAIGCAEILGFSLMTNFRRPYFAPTITDFWRRWHISLSTWFKDYVYIPLGGNRKGSARTYFNLFLTFVISGLWHGANWTFVVWGALHGFYQVVEKFFKTNIPSKRPVLRFIYYMIAMGLVMIAWVFFRANSISDASTIFGSFLQPKTSVFLDKTTLFYLFIGIFILIGVEAIQEFSPRLLSAWKQFFPVRFVAYICISVLILLIGVFDGDQFIYFQF